MHQKTCTVGLVGPVLVLVASVLALGCRPCPEAPEGVIPAMDPYLAIWNDGNLDLVDELSHLQWIPLEEVRDFHMPFITEVVLAEIAARLPDLSPPHDVPFFYNDAEESLFRRLGRTSAE